MKLVRFGASGCEKPGFVDETGTIRDISSIVDDLSGDVLGDEGLERIRAAAPSALPAVSPGERIGPCVGHVGKFICIGLNYSDHAAEAGLTVPSEPILFQKATSAITGPYDPVEIPRDADKTDWEVELGVVIGKRAKYLSETDDPLSYVAGYCTVNDVSERAFQQEGTGQWTKGKSHDTFGPIGPWLVTRDEIPDPQALDLWLEVDGKRHQSGNTALMVYSVRDLIRYISRFMTLEPGDLIATGTPPGVGYGMKPQLYLTAGQTMRLEVAGLGVQKQVTVDA